MFDKNKTKDDLLKEIDYLKLELEKYKKKHNKESYYVKLINNFSLGLVGIRVIYDNSRDISVPVDHLVEFYNQSALDILTLNYHLEDKEIKGKLFTEIFPDNHQIYEWIRDIGDIASKKGNKFEIKQYYSETLQKWFYFFIYVPEKGLYFVLIEDITEKVTIEKALSRSEKDFRHIFESSPIGIFQSTIQGKFVRVNPALANMLGFETPSELLEYSNQDGIATSLYVDPADRERIIEMVMDTYNWCDFVVRFKKKSGDIFKIKLYIRQVKSEQEPASYLEGFAEDVTERKRIQQELVDNKNKYQVLFEKMTSGFAYCKDVYIDENISPTLQILEINAALEKILNKPKKEIIGKFVKQVFPIFWTDEYNNIRKKINYHISRNKDFEVEIYLKFTDKWISVLSYVPREGYVAFMINDITERKKSEQRLETRLRYETAIVECSKTLLQTDIDIDQAMYITLQELLYASETSRIYIFQNKYVESKGLCMDMIYEKCQPNVKAFINDPTMHNLPYKDGLGGWKDILSKGRYIKGMVEDFPPDLQEIFNQQNILSILILPISVDGELYGFIGFDDVEKRREWNEEDIRLLRTVANMTGSYLERRNTLEEIRKSENRYKAVVEDQTELIIRYKSNGEITFVNDAYCRYFNVEKEKIIGYNHKELNNHRFYNKFINNIKSLNHDNPSITDEYEIDTPKGWRIIQMTDRVIYGYQDEIIEYQSVGKDITERKKAEISLKESESKYRTLFESANDGIFLMEGAKIIDCNKRGLDMFDVSDINEFIGKTPKDFSPEYQPDGKHSAEKERDMIIDAMTGKPQFYEWQCIKKDGSYIDLEVNLTSFESFNRNLLIAIVRDITNRKKVEEKIKSSLKEKEILLREVHHRVKNNLQIISSIINLQANNTKKEEIKTVIKEIRNRILSMAIIHEKLYQSDNIAKVEFSSYVRSLMMGLFTTYGITHDKVKMEIDVYNVPLNLDFVVPCGLIVNEIVSNSVKYAFPGDMKGKIKVRFKPLQDKNGYELDIIDNGIGMSKDIDFNKTETLGLRLIRALITQLGGDVKLVKNNGTHYHIDFKSDWYL